MEKIDILLCCGSGMSSGYLATRTRKAARKKGIRITIEAIPQSSVGSYLTKDTNIDIVLLGPHLASQYEMIRKLSEGCKTIVRIIPESIYGVLDGDKLLEFSINELNKRGD